MRPALLRASVKSARVWKTGVICQVSPSEVKVITPWPWGVRFDGWMTPQQNGRARTPLRSTTACVRDDECVLKVISMGRGDKDIIGLFLTSLPISVAVTVAINKSLRKAGGKAGTIPLEEPQSGEAKAWRSNDRKRCCSHVLGTQHVKSPVAVCPCVCWGSLGSCF